MFCELPKSCRFCGGWQRRRPKRRAARKCGLRIGVSAGDRTVRWYEVDPSGAHEEILRQIGSPIPLSMPMRSLFCRESLPEFETIWADALKRNENEDRQGFSFR